MYKNLKEHKTNYIKVTDAHSSCFEQSRFSQKLFGNFQTIWFVWYFDFHVLRSRDERTRFNPIKWRKQCDQILKKITRASKNMSMKLCKCTIDFHNSFSVLVYCCETVCRTCRLWSTAATTEQCKHVAVSICWYYHLVAMHEYRIHFIYSRILFYVHTVFLVYFIEANLLI